MSSYFHEGDCLVHTPEYVCHADTIVDILCHNVAGPIKHFLEPRVL